MKRELHILLVRHGQTDSNKDRVVQGHTQTPLNGLGREQAERVARRLARFELAIDTLVSSDLLRTTQTAMPIAAALGLPINYDPAWRERTRGIFDGKSQPERALLKAELNLADEQLPPGAQAREQHQEMILRAIEALPGRYPTARCIAVITHGGACRGIVEMLIDGRLPTDEPWSVDDNHHANCSVMHILRRSVGEKAIYQVRSINETAHLDQAKLTLNDAG